MQVSESSGVLRVFTAIVALATVAALVAVTVHEGDTQPAFVLSTSLLIVAALTVLVWHIPPAWTVTAGILLSVMTSDWQYFGIPNSASPQRLLLLAGIVTLICRGAYVRDRPPLPTRGVHYLMVAAGAYVIVSGLWAGTLNDKGNVFDILEAFGLIPFLLFWAAPVLYAKRRDRNLLVVTLVGLGLYLSLTALFETAHVWSLVWPHFIADKTFGIRYGHARGPFGDPIADSAAMFACAGACVIAFNTWRNSAARLLCVVVAALCLVGCILSLERSVWLGTAISIVVTSLAVKSLRRFIVPVLAALALIVIGAFVITPSGALQQRASDQSTVWDRYTMYHTAERVILDHPLFGVGWGNFRNVAVNGDYYRTPADYPLTAVGFDVHNAMLNQTAQLGLIGGTLWLLCIILGAVFALTSPAPTPDLRMWKYVFLSYAVFWAVVCNFIPPQFFFNLVYWLLAGVASAGRVQPVAVRRARRTPAPAPYLDRGAGPRPGPVERPVPA